MTVPSQVEHLRLDNNGVSLHIACLGEGPLVVLCHGFPGLWYSWRHQMQALAAAGYQVAALDMRGYGQSDRPIAVASYGYDQTSSDVLVVLDHFRVERAVVIGHDFGANLAWHMSVHRASRVRAVVALCVPYGMALAGGSEVLPSSLYAAVAEQHFFHMHYYQQIESAESPCVGREREFLAKLFWALCAQGELLDWEQFPMVGTDYIDVLAEPGYPLPWPWLSLEDFDYYLEQYLRAGPEMAFVGGINSYRAMDHNWLMFGDTRTAEVCLPALYIGGAEDPTVKLGSEADFEVMHQRVKDLRGLHLLPGSGHFLQQEQPQQLNALLLEFLAGL